MQEANLLIVSLITEAKGAADEREELRHQMEEHRNGCPGHCDIGVPH